MLYRQFPGCPGRPVRLFPPVLQSLILHISAAPGIRPSPPNIPYIW